MKLEGISFKNSETCEGVAFAGPNSPLDIAVIEISGRYPEAGWAVNSKIHETAYIKRGLGKLFIKDGVTIDLSEGDVVIVNPGQRFAWEGDMTLVMACSPPFDSEQHKEEDRDER